MPPGLDQLPPGLADFDLSKLKFPGRTRYGRAHALHIRGRGLPGGEPVDWWIVDGVLSAPSRWPAPRRYSVLMAPAAGSSPAWSTRTATSGSAVHGATDLDEAIAQAQTDRDAGALLLRDCGSPVDTRRLDDRDDLPGIIRAGRHIARPKRYMPGLPSTSRTNRNCPTSSPSRPGSATAGSSSSATGSTAAIGDLAPLWPDDVLEAAIDAAHADGARVTAHVFGEDALPGLINAGIDCIEHGTGLTDDTIGDDARHGTALVPTLINIENFPGIAEPRRTSSRPTPATCATCYERAGRASAPPARPGCRSTRAPTPAAWSRTAGSPTRWPHCWGSV